MEHLYKPRGLLGEIFKLGCKRVMGKENQGVEGSGRMAENLDKESTSGKVVNGEVLC